jgi:metal-sulfur cluster biosynthetic enzyme
MIDIIQIRNTIVEKLREVIDPELGVNIVDLGLVYQILVENGRVKVEFTTTTPGCPMRRYLQQQVEKAVSCLEGIDEYEVVMVMKPDWSVEMIKEGVEFFAIPPPGR